MKPSVVALVAVVIGALLGCRDKVKAEECDRVEPYVRASSTSSCSLEIGDEGNAKREAAVRNLEKEIGALRRLELSRAEVQDVRDKLLRFDTEEVSLCREYGAAQHGSASRSALAASLAKTASDRRGYIEGALGDCNRARHPPHF